VYDVRVGGGFPFTVPPPVCNNGDSCKAPVSAQPSLYGAPASATFSGAGNLAPPPPAVVRKIAKKTVKCKKNYAKNEKGKCVKKKKSNKKSKKASKSHRGAKS
jgi:hypothetical protein